MQMNVYTLNIYDSETKYTKYRQNIEGNDSSARSHIHRVSSMLLFCEYFVVYSAIPQVIKVNCIDCICIIQMCFDVFMYLRDFSRFFFFFFFLFF